MDGLTEGRIVHYVLPSGRSKGEHRPAIVVQVWREHEAGLVNLQVFTDFTNDALAAVWWCTSVHFDADKAIGTWHWIEPA